MKLKKKKKSCQNNPVVPLILCGVRVLLHANFTEKELFPHLSIMRNHSCTIFPLLGEKWLLLLKSIQTHKYIGTVFRSHFLMLGLGCTMWILFLKYRKGNVLFALQKWKHLELQWNLEEAAISTNQENDVYGEVQRAESSLSWVFCWVLGLHRPLSFLWLPDGF